MKVMQFLRFFVTVSRATQQVLTTDIKVVQFLHSAAEWNLVTNIKVVSFRP